MKKKIITILLALTMVLGIFGVATACGSSDTINVYNRESGSGTRDAFLELIDVDEEDLCLSTELASTGSVLTAVADDENGIGYISLGSVDSTVKALSVDNVAASAANIIAGSYSVSRPFELIYQQSNYDSNDLLADFITYLESADAQEVISDYGYVSVYSDAESYTKPTESFTTTTLTIGGSTSVQPLMSIDEDDVSCLITAYKEACGQDVSINYSGTGSGTGIANAADGTYDIGFASKTVTSSSFADGTDVDDMVIYQLCADGIAVIVNKNNSITNVSLDNLKSIYTGVITTWTELSEA